MRIAVLNPRGDEIDDTNTLVVTLPHEQAWKPSMQLRTELLRQIVAPDSRAVVFPNNTWQKRSYYGFDNDTCSRMANGDIRPFAEKQVRVLEKLGVSKVSVTGYSLGASAGIGIAAVGSPDIEITHVNADEAPSANRDAKQLQKDFMSSGGWSEQRAAIAQSAIPALSRAQLSPKLAMDYANFGLSTLVKENKALLQAMAGNISPLVETAVANYPDMKMKIGYVAGSLLVDAASLELPKYARLVEYSGSGSQMHATGDNIVAHALMALDGLNR